MHLTGHPVLQFVLVGLVLLGLLLLLSSWLTHRAALDDAISDARTSTDQAARSVVQPGLPPGLVAGSPEALEEMDTLTHQRLLGGWLVRVKVWTADGKVVYSDEARLIGRTFPLDADELEVFSSGGDKAELSRLDAPENQFEQSDRKLYEVYTRVRSPEGVPLLFEAYYSYDALTARGSQVVRGFLPIGLVTLLLFEAFTIPMVWRLARRLRRSQADRERLLLRAVESSEQERRRIARDLHDSVVQELAGASFALSASADSLRSQPTLAASVDRVAQGIRQSMRTLRSLLVEIYPPNLHREGLAAALGDLVAPMPGRGVRVTCDVPPDIDLPTAQTALVFRIAQEAVRNARRHSHATTIRLMLSRTPKGALLEVSDDGVGFDLGTPSGRDHVGVRMMHDLADEAGARLDVESAPGRGTVVRLLVRG